MKKISTKFIALALASILSSTSTGCANKDVEETVKPIETTVSNDYEINVLSPSELEEMVLSANVDSTSEKESIEEETEEEVYQIDMVDTITASEDTDIFDIDGNKLGTLPEGRRVKVNFLTDDNLYEVTYYDAIAYIDYNFVVASTSAEVTGKIQKMLYAENDTILTVPDYLSPSGEELEVKIDALECFEVYAEMDDSYLVQTIDYVGYISKDNLHELTGTFVVVDISSQELRLYKDNVLIYKCPVVTGTPTEDRHTDEGLWEIHTIAYNYALTGPGYSSPVDIMMKFHENEGLHDAEYHSCEFWKKKGLDRHGWRESSAFGGNTYKKNGSHGCVNMKHNDVFYVADHVTIGTPVLVKK